MGIELFGSPPSGRNPWRAAETGLLAGLAGAIPVVFDPHTAHAFNPPKLATLIAGAALLSGLEVGSALYRSHLGRQPHTHRSPAVLRSLTLAVPGWTAVSTLTSVSTPRSLLGARDSYDGLVLAATLAVVSLVASGPVAGRPYMSSCVPSTWPVVK
jgi:hypothetical protein